jgi:KDO2-lipid IV(A) lauroyltransferase
MDAAEGRELAQLWTNARREKLAHMLQASLVLPGFWLARFAPMRLVSWGGGMLARLVGPRTGASRLADRNLAWAMPSLAPKARRKIIRGMWENLGRTMAEFPLLPRMLAADARGRNLLTIEGIERVRAARGGDDRPMIVAVAHYGNWEVGQIFAARLGIALNVFYRPLNNPYVNKVSEDIRTGLGSVLLSKQREGGDARRALSILRRGGVLCMLVDQHYTGGLVAPFMGRLAKTSPAAVEFALHLDCPILPIRVERTRGLNFRVVVEPPVTLMRTGDRKADVMAGTLALNRVIERWVQERPEQWLWIHRRWRIGMGNRRLNLKRRRKKFERRVERAKALGLPPPVRPAIFR